MAFFICSNCGFGSASWIGRCPDCGKWNTLVEKPSFEPKETGRRRGEPTQKLSLTSLNRIKLSAAKRQPTEVFEFDRVTGGGFIPGEVILLTGEPGVGKSTLLLQSLQKLKTLYISGEESVEQIKNRGERLKIDFKNFFFSDNLQVEGIIKGLEEIKEKIDLVIIDSIQTIYTKELDSPPGSITQLKEVTKKIIIFAKKFKIPFILVGHITKEGDIAGPKTLEHLVDCVLTIEGEKISSFRILRASKNRFGSADEIGIFEMREEGMKEVNNPLAFLEEEITTVAGKAIVGVIEGKRPFFFEIQTLTVPTVLAVPRRVVSGVDYNKVLLLLAVIRKHLGIPFDKFDIYVNVAGGVNIKSTAVDLGIIASLLSSIKNFPLPKKSVFIGEVGLLGEIRKVFFQEKIINEAKRLKFSKIFSPLNITTIRDLKRIMVV